MLCFLSLFFSECFITCYTPDCFLFTSSLPNQILSFLVMVILSYWVSSLDPILLPVMVHMFYFFSCVLCLVLSDMIPDMVDFGLLSPRFHCTLIGFDLVLVCRFFFVGFFFGGGKIILFVRFFPDLPSEFVSMDLSPKKVSYTLPGVLTAMKALQVRIWGKQINSRQQVLLQAFSQQLFFLILFFF